MLRVLDRHNLPCDISGDTASLVTKLGVVRATWERLTGGMNHAKNKRLQHRSKAGRNIGLLSQEPKTLGTLAGLGESRRQLRHRTCCVSPRLFGFSKACGMPSPLTLMIGNPVKAKAKHLVNVSSLLIGRTPPSRLVAHHTTCLPRRSRNRKARG